MKVLLYGTAIEEYRLQNILQKNCIYRTISINSTENYDEYIGLLKQTEFDFIMITMKGAEGLEGVNAAMTLVVKTPRVWFSDDKFFGPQAFRLGVSYFGELPVTEEQLSMALIRCGIKKGET